MKTKIETYGKNGVIEIIGNPQESILYLKNKPIQYSWFAEVGSIWRFHIAQGLNKKALQLNNVVEKLLQSGIEKEEDFLTISKYFNTFLKYGSYEYGHYELPKDVNWIEIPKDENYNSFDYYGGSMQVSPTQNSIDDNIVNNYKEQILKGARPPIVLIHIENSWMFYILDGHHKFCAYGLANIKPYAIIITKLGNEYKPIEETIKLAKSMNCTNNEYINWMKNEKKNINRYKRKKLNLEKIFQLIKE